MFVQDAFDTFGDCTENLFSERKNSDFSKKKSFMLNRNGS